MLVLLIIYTPNDNNRPLESSPEQSCVNGFKMDKKRCIKKKHLTNFELVVKTKWSAHSLPFEVDAQI